MMANSEKKGSMAYPYGKGRLYVSALTTGVSIFVAILLGTETVWSYYAIFTLLMTAFAFVVKVYLSSLQKPKPQEGEIVDSKEAGAKWRDLILVFLLAIAFLFVPLFLVNLLEPQIWFALLLSLVSSLGFSELALYFYVTRRSISMQEALSRT
jgi:cobalamin synthase